jgi:Family of unknown function (DUF6653)
MYFLFNIKFFNWIPSPFSPYAGDTINKKNIIKLMTIERIIAQMFRMDDATWLRHANPLSVILRFTVLPSSSSPSGASSGLGGGESVTVLA